MEVQVVHEGANEAKKPDPADPAVIDGSPVSSVLVGIGHGIGLSQSRIDLFRLRRHDEGVEGTQPVQDGSELIVRRPLGRLSSWRRWSEWKERSEVQCHSFWCWASLLSPAVQV